MDVRSPQNMTPGGDIVIRDDRRKHPRTAFGGPVLVDSRKEVSQARALDVSAGGIRMESEHPLPLGEEVDLYFELKGLAVETRARVIRREGHTHSLAFQRGSRVSVPARRYSFRHGLASLVA